MYIANGTESTYIRILFENISCLIASNLVIPRAVNRSMTPNEDSNFT